MIDRNNSDKNVIRLKKTTGILLFQFETHVTQKFFSVIYF